MRFDLTQKDKSIFKSSTFNLCLSFCLLVVLNTGCSSADKVAEEDESAAEQTATSAEAVQQTSIVLPEKSSKKNEQNSVQTNALYDAIRSGSDEAIYKASTQALLAQPQDIKALTALGMYHYRKNRPLMSLYFFSKVQALKSNSSDLHNNMGLAYLALKDKKEAIRSFRKAYELNPNDINVVGNLSSLYLQSRDYAKANMILDPVIKKGTKDIKLLTNSAIASAAKGKVEQAESLYKEVFRVNSNYKEGLFNYAVLQIIHQKKMKDGLETLSRLKFLGPGENMRLSINALEKRANTGLK